jgi:ABC-type multidrug transport system fused ATPase/permease subunit
VRSSICGEGRAFERPHVNVASRIGVSAVSPSVHFVTRHSCYSPLHVAVIDVHSFGFTYPGAQRPAVRDVAFSVEPGEIFGFLGPSGAGKSTTQNVLIRLLDGYEGKVSVLGKDRGSD